MKQYPLSSALGATATFRLALLGAETTRRFVEAVEDLHVKPKHVGLLALLADSQGRSQRELATVMAVAPSLVVALVDELEALHAVHRLRGQHDRRRQEVALTPTGRDLLDTCAQRATALDDDLLASLDPPQRRHLRNTLGHLLSQAEPQAPEGASG